ncbi:MAG: Na+/H+ antiporter NhaA [Proteobacteria bacterium]|nr:Na+/H+ antiporter NhaA [Pseudomonadota bacterium]
MNRNELNNNFIADFLRLESAGGILLIAAAGLAIIFANTPLATTYQALLNVPVEVRVSDLEIAKPLLLWINDGLMAIFFFLVGLELKREIVEGELSDPRKLILPGVGAIGGMLVPALIYVWFNRDDAFALQGWAIPAATDIAFALGILALLGSRVPTALKVFLTSLAIIDDIGAIVIIAIFYTANLSMLALLIVIACLPVAWWLNRRNVVDYSPYILIGVIMWVAMLKSGVHATLAGVIMAFFIPLKDGSDPEHSPLKELEHDLHGIVAFFVLPVFAFVNAGIDLRGISADQVFHAVPIGIALGLFLGKQLGIFGMCLLAVKTGLTKLPREMSLTALYGTSVLCGVGFTMSLFIGSLAFDQSGVNLLFDERLGIIAGSIASGILGYLVLRSHLGKVTV